MKKNLRYCFLIGVVLICMTSSQAQVRMTRKIDGDGAFHLKELQAILTSKDDTVKILMVLPENLRPEGYRKIKVLQGDEILMMNAKRMRSIAAELTGNNENE
ncbi:MAG: hypothetical protein ACE5IR_18990 [bacterium]